MLRRVTTASSAKATTPRTTSKRSNPASKKSVAVWVCSTPPRKTPVVSMSTSPVLRLICPRVATTNTPASSTTSNPITTRTSSRTTRSRRWSMPFCRAWCASWRRLAVWLCERFVSSFLRFSRLLGWIIECCVFLSYGGLSPYGLHRLYPGNLGSRPVR